MRHKLYKTASQIIQEQKLSNEIEIDSQYLSINLKGTKLENMPRYSKKKRGKQSAYRGISHHKVCVTCAICVPPASPVVACRSVPLQKTDRTDD